MAAMKSVTVLYHCEDGVWWAESSDLPGWSAAGDDFDAVREQVYGGVLEFAGPSIIWEVGGELRVTAPSDSMKASRGSTPSMAVTPASPVSANALCS